MATSITSTTMTLKLLVDTHSKKVLFAEAGKDFVDFLFRLLRLPLSSILALLVESKITVSGSLGKIYNSMQDLDTDYLQPNQTKNLLLKPKPASSHTKHSPFLNDLAYYSNAGSSGFFFTSGERYARGVVTDVVTHMVMDDLTVKPMSTISSITLLSALRVKDIGCLEERTVQVDLEKGLKLLKLSFVSTTVLTDLFLEENSKSAKENPSVETVD